jgi:hypothetical protein
LHQDEFAAKFFLRPFRLVLFVLASIALADLVTMWALSAFLQGLSAPVQIAIQSAALAITIRSQKCAKGANVKVSCPSLLT